MDHAILEDVRHALGAGVDTDLVREIQKLKNAAAKLDAMQQMLDRANDEIVQLKARLWDKEVGR